MIYFSIYLSRFEKIASVADAGISIEVLLIKSDESEKNNIDTNNMIFG